MNSQRTVTSTPLKTERISPRRAWKRRWKSWDGHRKCEPEVAATRPRLSGTCSSRPSADEDAGRSPESCASRHWIHVGGERRLAASASGGEASGGGEVGVGRERRWAVETRLPGWVAVEGARPGRCGPRLHGCLGAAAWRGPSRLSSALAGLGASWLAFSAPVTGLLSRRFWVDVRQPRRAPVRDRGFCPHSTVLAERLHLSPCTPEMSWGEEGVAGIQSPSGEGTHSTRELLLL